jgi:hypothetical protein
MKALATSPRIIVEIGELGERQRRFTEAVEAKLISDVCGSSGS